MSVGTIVPGGADPFAAPPEIEKSLSFAAAQRHGRCFTTDATLQPVLFRIKVRGIDPSITAPGRYVLNLAIVIDRSGSMQGQSLEQVKRACSALLDMMAPRDYVSVVAFAESADLVWPARYVNSKSEAKDAINRVAAGNTTNLYQGLQVAYQQLLAVKNARTLNRLVLITDGVPTAGTKDFGAIMGQVAEQKTRGISVSTIGLGTDYGEELLAGLAHRTGGNFYHVPEPERLTEVFRKEFWSVSRVVAQNLRLRVHLANGVSVRQVYGHQPTYGNRVVNIMLSDLEADTELKSLWEFELSARTAGLYRIAHADIRYDDLNTGRPERLSANLLYQFTAEDLGPDNGPGSEQFDEETVVAEAIRTVDKTLLAVRRQNLDAAAVIMELDNVHAILLANGREKLADAISAATADIQSGAAVAKTLTNVIFNLDQGKAH